MLFVFTVCFFVVFWLFFMVCDGPQKLHTGSPGWRGPRSWRIQWPPGPAMPEGWLDGIPSAMHFLNANFCAHFIVLQKSHTIDAK